MDLSDPNAVLPPVDLKQYLKKAEPTSPATDLAFLRFDEKNGRSTKRQEDLINAKWRIRYIQNYHKETEVYNA